MFKKYIAISSLYRFSSGALSLAMSWIISTSTNSFIWLGLLIILTFLPALVIPTLWKNKPKLRNNQITAIGCLFSGIISITIFYITQKTIVVIVLNTFIWTFFFLLESSWEAWFSEISKNNSSLDINKYSSLSFLFNQLSLMSGPLILSYITNSNANLIILVCGSIFLICSLLCLYFGSRNLDTDTDIKNNNITEENNSLICTQVIDNNIYRERYRIFLCLMLVWPVLATFNFMLPIQMILKNNTLFEASYLDAAMGIGMALVGFLIGYITIFNNLYVKYKLGFILLLISLVLWIKFPNLYFQGLSILLLGFTFNFIRIHIRKYLATWPDHEVGHFVSKSNAVAFPCICICITIQTLFLSINWIIPFVLCFIILLVIPKKIINMTVAKSD